MSFMLRRSALSSILALLGLTGIAAFYSSPATGQTKPTLDRSRSAATPTPSPSPTIREEDQIIKIETELVNLNVRVVDRNNRPISGIRQAEFKIYEDNVPQRIEFFSFSEVPTNYGIVVETQVHCGSSSKR